MLVGCFSFSVILKNIYSYPSKLFLRKSMNEERLLQILIRHFSTFLPSF